MRNQFGYLIKLDLFGAHTQGVIAGKRGQKQHFLSLFLIPPFELRFFSSPPFSSLVYCTGNVKVKVVRYGVGATTQTQKVSY